MEYMDRQHRQYQAEGGIRNDQIQNRSHSQSSQSQNRADQYPPPTPLWESWNFRTAHRSSSVRQLDPGDVRSRSTLTTRSDPQYHLILPAPSQPQRQYVSLEKQRSRCEPVMKANKCQGANAGQDSMHAISPRHTTSTASPAHLQPVPGIRPPLPKGLIRHGSKDDLGRALQELTDEASRAMAEGKVMKKVNRLRLGDRHALISYQIHEFARVVQLFSAHYGMASKMDTIKYLILFGISTTSWSSCPVP